MDKRTEQLILEYALQNAIFYNGKANPGAVLGKVLSAEPGLKEDVDSVKKSVEEIVKKVNKLSLPEQKKQLESLAPELLEKKPKEEKEGLPDLPDAKEGHVITRFAPSPTGPLNILHVLRAVMLSYLYARKYKGKFYLRIEDTDPGNIGKEYYGMIESDLESVGAKPDKLLRESDDMEEYYRHAEQLLKEGKAYPCFCGAGKFKQLKLDRQDCPCRKKDASENLGVWKRMAKGGYKEGEVALRFKTSMSEPNPAIRDPAIMRVVDAPHPLKGDKYKAWPLYNFANVVEDHRQGITHVFRGKEHEHNTAVQKKIYDALGWGMPSVLNFGMIYLPGEKLHTRDIREKISKGEYSGWDDPRLHTIQALARRGFQPRAFQECAITCGLSKNDIRFSWEMLEAANRKAIDPLADRYMAVIDPVEIDVKELLQETKIKDKIKVKVHPEKDRTREISVTDKIYISKEDFDKFKGKEARLIDLFNVKLDKKPRLSKDISRHDEAMPKMQWVSEKNVKVKIVKPEGTIEALGEEAMGRLKPGDIIQMLRVGFARVDSIGKNSVAIYFAHK